MTAEDRAKALAKKIAETAKEFADQGMKSDAYGLAAGAILCGQLVKALERIDRLEGDIKLLTDLLASVEEKR
ncbi:hypothetical protein D9M70_467670 [compost metagenome]